MPENKIDSMIAGENKFKDFSVDSQSTDGIGGGKETEWIDSEFNNKFGYYTDEKTPEITAIIDAHSKWTVGKGFQADEITTMLLDTIKGNGFDTFNSILENADRTMQIGGNFYAEIIRDDENGLIIKKFDGEDAKRITSILNNKFKKRRIIKNSMENIKKLSLEKWGKELTKELLK